MKRLQTVVELEIPFHDVDALGVVWHGHYYKYLELARTKLLSARGLDGAELLATGHRFYVVESKCRYTYPLHYRDRARVIAWLREWEHRLVIAYEVKNLTADRRSARAHTILATIDQEGSLLLDTPRALLDRLLD
jgi:acyl-CoA thioester hydrolase